MSQSQYGCSGKYKNKKPLINIMASFLGHPAHSPALHLITPTPQVTEGVQEDHHNILFC